MSSWSTGQDQTSQWPLSPRLRLLRRWGKRWMFVSTAFTISENVIQNDTVFPKGPLSINASQKQTFQNVWFLTFKLSYEIKPTNGNNSPQFTWTVLVWTLKVPSWDGRSQLKQWFSTTGWGWGWGAPLLPQPLGHLAKSGNIFGCHDCGFGGWRGCCWNLVGRGHGVCPISYSAQDRPKIVTVPRWRNPALDISGYSHCHLLIYPTVFPKLQLTWQGRSPGRYNLNWSQVKSVYLLHKGFMEPKAAPRLH